MNFIFPDTPEALAAATPGYDFGWIFALAGFITLFFLFISAIIKEGPSSFASRVTVIIILVCGILSLLGGVIFSTLIRPAMIAEAEANSPEPVSVVAVFQQAVEDTYGFALTEQNAQELLTREGYQTLERHQLEGAMRDGEAGQVWRAGQIEIAPDGQYQALQLIWVDDEWLLIDITDPTRAGIQELEHVTGDTN